MDLIRADGKPLSTFQIARVLPRERVIAVPSHWTNLHLDLLNCSFGRVTYDHPVEEEEAGPNTLHLLFQSFANVNAWKRAHSVPYLMCQDKKIYQGGCLGLFFEGKIAEVFPCTTFHAQPVSKHERSPPFAVYLDMKRLQWIREDYHEPSSKMYGDNAKIARAISDIKIKQTTPENPMHDPYIPALLVAMAQEQQASAAEIDSLSDVLRMTVWRPPVAVIQNVADQTQFRPKLILAKPRSDFVYLYETNINSMFLCKFSDPGVKPPCSTNMEIRISAIPIKPIYTLGRRLNELVLPF
ncbi:unnamed protein product [Clonostachys byssicola]|uniref:Uncharacterized protein n=1 Tax=Clonostachys byssicola TaxID=160290 RepID=A0A9N9UHY8_9HYPO|nr:unnamed protein product [Clonostachys byssicola]